MHPDLLLMLLADARLPVAGHTQSGSLEPALSGGLVVEEIPSYLRVRIQTVVRIEMATAVVAHHRIRKEGPAADLAAVGTAWAARTASPALREASRLQGQALRRLAISLWPNGGGLKALGAAGQTPRAVVLGALAADLGVDATRLAHLIGYDDVQTVAAAALKLAPLDPTVVTGWVADVLPEIAAAAAAIVGVTEPEAIPATGAPQIELWAQAHAATTRRLFRA